MVYKYKCPGLIPVPAQVAGEELDRIYKKYGQLKPADVVAENAKTGSPLHKCFEWDDSIAAEKYREGQAQFIIQSIVSVQQTDNEPKEVRAFVSIKREYMPINVVVNSKDLSDELMRSALAELQTFQKKYATLQELANVFKAIDELKIKEG